MIGRITPSGAISEFEIPPPEARPNGIVAGPGGTIWFTDELSNSIGRVKARLLPGAAAGECVVPRLAGRTLAQAKRLLDRAHCKLGKLSGPPQSNHNLVVVAQRPAAKKTLPGGSKVSVRLG